jgi:predicted ATP-dependent endonuclease of OLD family
MQLFKVIVKNFRSLKNVEVRGFGDVNMVFGVNNSGKSNFLSFLELIFRSKEIKVPTTFTSDQGEEVTRLKVEKTGFWEGYVYGLPFLFTDNDREKSIEFSVFVEIDPKELGKFSKILIEEGILTEDGHRNYFEFNGYFKSISEFDSEFKMNKIKIRDTTIFSVDDNSLQQFFPENQNLSNAIGSEGAFELISIFSDCILLINSYRYFTKEVDSQESKNLTSGTFKNWLFSNYLNADKYQQFVDLEEFLNRIQISKGLKDKFNEELSNFPFDNLKISFSKFDSELEVMLETNFGRLPLKNYGTGIQQILYLFTKVFESKSRIFLIEEIELNLSRIYQEIIIHNFKELIDNKFLDQLIFTCHSDHYQRNDFIHFQTSIDKENGTTLKKIDNIKEHFDKIHDDFKNMRLE